MKKVSIIIPCYNEEKALPIYFNAVDPVIKDIKDFTFDFVLVNDGSKDNTLKVMEDLYNLRNDIIIVSFTRNFGQNAAFSAGLKYCDGDYAIMMDSDLQDPVDLIPQICNKFLQGYEVVNPHRVDRSSDTFIKRKTAEMFYKLINKLEGKEVNPENVNCFRGLSRKAIDLINSLPESDRLIRSEVPFVGYKVTNLDFTREKRSAGESKFNMSKMFLEAFNNISTSTSKPLYTPIKVGFISSIINGLAFFVLLILNILHWCNVLPINTFTNVASPLLLIMFAVFLAMSIVIFFIGIISIYLHNILINTRNRPTYVVDVFKKPEDK